MHDIAQTLPVIEVGFVRAVDFIELSDEGVLELVMGIISFGIIPFPARLVAQTIKFMRGRFCGVIQEFRIIFGEKFVQW